MQGNSSFSLKGELTSCPSLCLQAALLESLFPLWLVPPSHSGGEGANLDGSRACGASQGRGGGWAMAMFLRGNTQTGVLQMDWDSRRVLTLPLYPSWPRRFFWAASPASLLWS